MQVVFMYVSALGLTEIGETLRRNNRDRNANFAERG